MVGTGVGVFVGGIGDAVGGSVAAGIGVAVGNRVKVGLGVLEGESWGFIVGIGEGSGVLQPDSAVSIATRKIIEASPFPNNNLNTLLSLVVMRDIPPSA